jgi:adenosylmethionine-8-amino-7-oxononanoate aminotransferase
MSKVFPRSFSDQLPTAVAGEGIYLTDETGKKYLDGSCGALVSNIGHGNAKVIQAIQQQAEKLAFAHTAFFTNQPMEELADFLAQRSPGDLNISSFVSGGSEAVETALKIAHQYHRVRGEEQRVRIISRKLSYHGNTMGALGASGELGRTKPFDQMYKESIKINSCYAYRDKGEKETDLDYGHRLANELRQTIATEGADTISALLLEPVVGASLGAVPPVEGYLAEVREICSANGILLIFDEVMCGMGRTGHLFACQSDAVTPDMIVTAKGLASGYQPIGAVLMSEGIFQALKDSGTGFISGHTYMGHSVACAAALAVQKFVEDNDLLTNVRARAEQLEQELHASFDDHPHVGDIRGRGLMLAIELVKDKPSKEPFAANLQLASRIQKRAMQEGLLIYPKSGFLQDNLGDLVMIAPPFILNEEDVGVLVTRLGQAVDAVFAEFKT